MNKQSLLWSLILVVLLLLLFTPLIMVAMSLAMIPVVYLFVRLDGGRFVLHYALALLAVYGVTALFGAGTLGTIAAIYSLFLLIPSIVMGILYKRKAAARSVLTGGTVAFLAQMLLFLVLLTLFGVHVTDEMREFVRSSMETLPAELRQMLPEHLIDQVIEVMIQLLPLYLIGMSAYFSVVTHWLGRKALIRAGEPIPGLRPAKEWMLPKSFVWYYLVALVLSFIFTEPNGSMIAMVLLNVFPLLMFAFTIQAFAFFFFVADARGWSRGVPIAIAIVSSLLMMVIPGLMQLFTLLGLFDIAFPIRGRLKKS
ncbi:DUF2232 domain-containing protein [Paenibacillus flagellatus]|uniref:DUF2232 domain-containing protein n=1 Tax=Paenibacillus flagellatus TaxID=2211139 RepID=A0A2V5K460_9BACL|nr:DUF2232 domain-containing protein [Paenibacillus flagellatus]PYI52403.1 DUF2232 domain-containing protein [Paenibacillus flagellatus]